MESTNHQSFNTAEANLRREQLSAGLRKTGIHIVPISPDEPLPQSTEVHGYDNEGRPLDEDISREDMQELLEEARTFIGSGRHPRYLDATNPEAGIKINTPLGSNIAFRNLVKKAMETSSRSHTEPQHQKILGETDYVRRRSMRREHER